MAEQRMARCAFYGQKPGPLVTTDQPTRCSEQWRYIDGTFGERCVLPPHPPGTLHEADFGDGMRHWQTEPPPTSSLEEARMPTVAESRASRAGEVFREQAEGAQWLAAGRVDAERLSELWFYAGWNLARAEVIREVEPHLEEALGWLNVSTASVDDVRFATQQINTALRALSQGGEGKA